MKFKHSNNCTTIATPLRLMLVTVTVVDKQIRLRLTKSKVHFRSVLPSLMLLGLSLRLTSLNIVFVALFYILCWHSLALFVKGFHAMMLTLVSAWLVCTDWKKMYAHVYLLIPWWLQNKLSPIEGDDSLWIIQLLTNDSEVLKLAAQHCAAREQQEDWGNIEWHANKSGGLVLFRHTFGDWTPELKKQCILANAVLQILDDYLDTKEDDRDNKPNYFLTCPNPKPIGTWLEECKCLQRKWASNPDLSRWLNGWLKLYQWEGIVKAKRCVELDELCFQIEEHDAVAHIK